MNDPTPLMSNIGKHLTDEEREILRAPLPDPATIVPTGPDVPPVLSSVPFPTYGRPGTVLVHTPGEPDSWLISSESMFVILLYPDGQYLLRTLPNAPVEHRLWIAPHIVKLPTQLCECLTIWLSLHVPEQALFAEKLLWAMRALTQDIVPRAGRDWPASPPKNTGDVA